jgi:hypothetical protein
MRLTTGTLLHLQNIKGTVHLTRTPIIGIPASAVVAALERLGRESGRYTTEAVASFHNEILNRQVEPTETSQAYETASIAAKQEIEELAGNGVGITFVS